MAESYPEQRITVDRTRILVEIPKENQPMERSRGEGKAKGAGGIKEQQATIPGEGGTHLRVYEEPKTRHGCLYPRQSKPCKTSAQLASEAQYGMNQDSSAQFATKRFTKLKISFLMKKKKN